MPHLTEQIMSPRVVVPLELAIQLPERPILPRLKECLVGRLRELGEAKDHLANKESNARHHGQ